VKNQVRDGSCESLWAAEYYPHQIKACGARTGVGEIRASLLRGSIVGWRWYPSSLSAYLTRRTPDAFHQAEVDLALGSNITAALPALRCNPGQCIYFIIFIHP
jgi:hypothetical protein